MIGATVCSGIGAPEVAAPWVDWRLSSEIEAFPRAVLQQRLGARDIRRGYHGGNALWGDFTAIRPRHLRRFGIPAPDLIVAGTPCQAFSIAGLRKGLLDPRGNLTLAFIRFCDAIDNLRRAAGKPPAFILWENVPGVFSTAGNPFGAFLAGLVGSDAPVEPPPGRNWTDAGVVSGPRRCAAWRVLDAQHFGLAQRRKRVYVLAGGGAGEWACADALLPILESVRWHPAPRREAGKGAARPVASSSRRGSGYRNDADTADNLIPALAACVTGREGKGPDSDATTTLVAHSLRADGFDASEDGTGRSTPLVAVPILEVGKGSTSRGAGPNGASFGRPGDQGAPAIAFDCKAGGETGFSIDDLPGALRGEGHGGGHAAVAFTQNSRSEVRQIAGDGTMVGALSADHGAQQQNYIAGSGVRRLTPTECERLQGFPEQWTAITYRGKPAADGPRYRALGNSMATKKMRWLLERIAAVAGVKDPGREAA